MVFCHIRAWNQDNRFADEAELADTAGTCAADNQVVRVEKGERLYFDLEEDVDAGSRWDFTCDDKDVEVTIDHKAPGTREEGQASDAAAVRIRIHRGYDGPTAIRFFRKKRGEPIEKEFTITLYRRIGDYAFWE